MRTVLIVAALLAAASFACEARTTALAAARNPEGVVAMESFPADAYDILPFDEEMSHDAALWFAALATVALYAGGAARLMSDRPRTPSPSLFPRAARTR